MIRVITLSLIMSLLLLAQPSQAKQKIKKTKSRSRSSLSTDVRFDSDTVYGKYQFADEALATVEDEKLLTSLLGVRTDFKDRLQLETKKR
jgi:hypothetical protein